MPKSLIPAFRRIEQKLSQLNEQYLLGEHRVWEKMEPWFRQAVQLFNDARRAYDNNFVKEAVQALKDAEAKIAAAWEAKKHVRPAVRGLAGRQGPGDCEVAWIYVGYWDPVHDPYREQEITETQAKRLIDEIHKIGKQFEGREPMPSFKQVLERACSTGEASVLFRAALEDPNGNKKLYHGIHAMRKG